MFVLLPEIHVLRQLFIPRTFSKSTESQSPAQSVKGPAPKDDSRTLTAIKDWEPDSVRTGIYPTSESTSDEFASALSTNIVIDWIPAAGALPTLQTVKEGLISHFTTSQRPASK